MNLSRCADCGGAGASSVGYVGYVITCDDCYDGAEDALPARIMGVGETLGSAKQDWNEQQDERRREQC